ncbi:MAG: metallophosphoesterase [Sulfuricurvum sp.]|uniref:metallophosphoesterase n=1 Tax=Sulfuricurvum sp. TaxID=2025608 RepID=UPI0025E26E32|nr:metallophosphoesterase [Sulfuricurvum sp.]MBV5321201.1 metallophosphoesterase [Sulfuricurvum sp.]
MKTLFPLIATIFFAMVHYLTYTRVVSHLRISTQTRTLLKYFLIFNMIGVLGYLSSRYLISPPKYLYFLFSLTIGVGFFLFIGTIVYEFLHLAQRIIPFNPQKRAFFKRASDLGFLSVGSAYLGAAVLEGSKEPVIQFVDVNQNRFNGKSYRIVQISDMHIGGLIDKEFVAKSVKTINALNPDLIAITGDLSDAHISMVQNSIDELRHLKSRFGTFYVIGNHEYFHSLKETIEHVKTLGIHVLENSSISINNDFYIAGVYDLFGFRASTYLPDITKAMGTIPPQMPTLLLAHQPKYIEYLEGFTPSLILSGHTHGGQIWPFHYLVTLAQPYLKGLYPLGKNRHIYVNSGIGFWGPPMRLGAQAEITCITWS